MASGVFDLVIMLVGNTVEVGTSVVLDICVFKTHDDVIPDPDPLMSTFQRNNHAAFIRQYNL